MGKHSSLSGFPQRAKHDQIKNDQTPENKPLGEVKQRSKDWIQNGADVKNDRCRIKAK